MGKRIMRMSGEFWQKMCTKGWSGDGIECIEGLPEGAVFCSADYLWRYNAQTSLLNLLDPGIPELVFTFEHPDWPEAKDDSSLPEVEVVFRVIRL